MFKKTRQNITNEGGLRRFYENRRAKFLSYCNAIVRYLYLIAIACFIFGFFQMKNVDLNLSLRVLEAIITCLGILVGIIITYLFSKLYSERSERIMRKRNIDELSAKITACRRIASMMRSRNEFWDNFIGLRLELDTRRRNFTLLDFLNLDYDELSALTNSLGEQTVQTYLSVKYLEKPDGSPFNPYDLHNYRNYSLKELESMLYGASVIWSFFNRGRYPFRWDMIYSGDKEVILNNLNLIYPHRKSTDYDNETLITVFSDIQAYITNSYNLTYLNNIPISNVFGKVIFNVLAFVFIMLCSLIVLNIGTIHLSLLTNILLTIFIVNMFDFIINIYRSIKSDLSVTEFYNIVR